MTYLGYRNPLYRAGRTLWGWCTPVPSPRPLPSDFYIIGHRGAAMLAPENTLVAFEKALALGANALETDVCCTQDACFILWHDADPNDALALARQIGGEGLLYQPNVPALGSPWRRPVYELSLKTVQTHYGYSCREPILDTDRLEDTPPEVPIVVFEAFLAWLSQEPRVQHVFLDLKFPPTHVEAALALLEILRQHSTTPDVRKELVWHLLSPHIEVVKALLTYATSYPLPATLRICGDFEFPGVRKFTRKLGMHHVSMGCGVRTWVDFRREVARIVALREQKRLGSIVTWTVNDITQLRELVALGVNGIMTDDPALLHDVVEEHRLRSGNGV